MNKSYFRISIFIHFVLAQKNRVKSCRLSDWSLILDDAEFLSDSSERIHRLFHLLLRVSGRELKFKIKRFLSFPTPTTFSADVVWAKKEKFLFYFCSHINDNRFKNEYKARRASRQL